MNVAVPPSLTMSIPALQLANAADSLLLNAVLFDDAMQSAPIILCQDERQSNTKLGERYDHAGLFSERDLEDALMAFCQPYRNEMSGDQERIAYTAYSHHVGTRKIVARDWHGALSVLERKFEQDLGDDYDIQRDPHLALVLSVQ